MGIEVNKRVSICQNTLNWDNIMLKMMGFYFGGLQNGEIR